MRRWFPWGALAACLAFVLSGMVRPRNGTDFNAVEFGRLPVLANGRIKPFDTVARTSLLIIRGKQSLQTVDGRYSSPAEWLLQVMMEPGKADRNRIFRIDHPDVLGLFGWRQEAGKYFSFEQLIPFLEEIEEQGKLAEAIEAQVRSPFQREIFKLYQRLLLYHGLKNTLCVESTPDFQNEIAVFMDSIAPGVEALRKQQAGQAFEQKDLDRLLAFADRYELLAGSTPIRVVPPWKAEESPDQWSDAGESLLVVMKGREIHPAILHYAAMVSAYRGGHAQTFNHEVIRYQERLETLIPGQLGRVRYEFFFNQFQPFYRCMTLYVLAFLLAWLSWLAWAETLRRAAFQILLLAFIVHSFGLISRMYLQGRPPVTNLYSSAIFVGWGAVLLSLVLERTYRNSIGNVAAGLMGFLTLLIAHNLSGDGDTLEMLRAVLDTNYWLATHVVVVTTGYASTFLAGLLAIIYIVRSTLTRSFAEATARSLSRMVYGIVCFATLFSFVGTMLGGLWADQSWGRFWGWDPKENGALLIVLWNAIILHARWGGLIGERGLMVMAVFGNVVTSFSWFGVNMLGIGLHSYGFMDRAFLWLLMFDLSQIVIMVVGMLPPHAWREIARGRSPFVLRTEAAAQRE